MKENMVPTIIKAKQGNEEAMVDLLMEFQKTIIKHSRRYSSSIDEDCYQELCIKFILGVKKFDLNRYLNS